MTDIRVQICYARPQSHDMRELDVREGATLQFAIEQSGILRDVPEIDLAACRVGVYGKLKALDTVLRDGDRVEIYRPLVADPKESRRRRAVKKEVAKSR
ncbi:RnfH family protein [Noviherbaspirillum sp.]|uniref:RnfH family protein n=1 Tax=Noviherbaspirillum sp. TaxID=1926288 RepID=UPI002B49A30B|nr:RnfH family protein [Noviherbaspirillum sp.]HJV82691.1 RnfH family protein [Noviherbaspirillum sp.]